MDAKFVLELGACIALWYFSSAVANTTSRKVLTQCPLPLTLTLSQFLHASLFGFLMLRVAQVKEFKPIPEAAKENFRKLTLVYSVGFLFVNAGYVLVNVSLAETLRSAEPLVTVILAILFLKSEPVSRMEMLSMVPIVVGGALSSLGDSSFSLMGLLFVCISNLSFSLRSMYTKKLKEQYDGDAFNVFYQVSLLGAKYLGGLLVASELIGSMFAYDLVESEDGSELRVGSSRFFFRGNIEKLFTLEILQVAFLNGITYVTYNQTSFYVLSRVRMVTHGVANAFRRIVTILFSVWYFQNEINAINAFGITLAICGVVMYAKAKDASTASRGGPGMGKMPYASQNNGMLMKSGAFGSM